MKNKIVYLVFKTLHILTLGLCLAMAVLVFKELLNIVNFWIIMAFTTLYAVHLSEEEEKNKDKRVYTDPYGY